MVNIDNHLGRITVSREYLVSLIGHTVTGCFGVAGMNHRSTALDAVAELAGVKDSLDKGVNLKYSDNKLIIDLHITVTMGVNITAIVDSITNKVRFAVEEATGIEVYKINIYVDGMKS
ncbi:MAG: Asp23/Gls24 family envelope stress response protein [Oscillospiraceae bacterium]|nr:Asp23/Gls24 family envelope stress response protein [Oscillospiraceae bacterium]